MRALCENSWIDGGEEARRRTQDGGGKARSSQNARRHGVRARCAWLLPEETQEEFDAVEEGWREQFAPGDYQ